MIKLTHSLTALALAAAATAAFAAAQSGTVKLELTQEFGVEQNGSYSAAGTKMCQESMGGVAGSPLKVSYSIDPSTMIESATADFMGESVPLYPLGISGTYSFMSDGVPQSLKDKHVNRIIFKLDVDFSHPEGDVMFTPGGEYNCVISNMTPN
ncbi:hypothetical protein [Leisingera sp. JC11]|uniref:hypothetical protein n=1 Tax=Leisingera sp. JC11 TaxID=3042469 RepID=UPI003452A889